MMGGMMGSMFNRRDNDGLLSAALMNGNNNWNNSPWMYLIFLALFGGNGFGFGNRGNAIQDAEIQGQIQSLRTQLSDNHNSDLLMSAIKGNNDALNTLGANLNCDFNQLQNAVCSVRSAIEQVSGNVGFSAERVINAVNLGDLNMIQQMKDCCCQTQQNIIKMGYENQLGQKDLQNAMQQGFSYTNTGIERAASSIGNLIQQLGCDLKTNDNANTQKLIDVITNNRYADLHERLDDAKRREQTVSIIASLKGSTTTTGTTTTT